MGKYQSLNVLNQNSLKREISGDAVDQVAAMINNSSKNRAQRRRLEKQLGKVANIYSHVQAHVDRSAFKEFQCAADSNMRRFFSVLGIVLEKEYGWHDEENNEPIADLFDKINTRLDEYQELSTDDVAKICEEVTGITLISE